jgi:hypothetical protein
MGTQGLGWIRYKGVNYPIRVGGAGLLAPDGTPLLAPDGTPLLVSYHDSTTKRYIYFDPNAEDPSVLYATDDIEDLRGQERFLMCVNDHGVPHVVTPPRRIGLDGDEIFLESITTPKIEEDGVTQQVTAFTASSTFIGQVETEEQTASIVTVGGRVEIYWGGRISPYVAGDGAEVTLALYRDLQAGGDETLIREITGIVTEAGRQERAFFVSVDAPAAGSWRYYLMVHTEVTDPQLYAWIGDRTIQVSEYKR